MTYQDHVRRIAIWPADARVEVRVLGQGYGNHAVFQIGFDNGRSIYTWRQIGIGEANIDRSMRPGRLRQEFYSGTESLVAFHQNNVPDLQDRTQMFRRADGE